MLTLFDAYAGFGGHKAGQRRAASPEELSRRMQRLSIARALVRTAPEDLDGDFVASNEALFRACERFSGFVPCPVVVPDAAGDAGPEDEQVAGLIARGAGAAALRPKRDGWILDDWVAGKLLAALQDRRLPAFCKEDQVALPEVAELARRYPALPVILADFGFRRQRLVLALLKEFPGVRVCLGGGFSVHRGIEQIVARAGPERILFGSGFPGSEPMAAACQLIYADIPEADRALIASGNLQTLLGGIRR